MNYQQAIADAIRQITFRSVAAAVATTADAAVGFGFSCSCAAVAAADADAANVLTCGGPFRRALNHCHMA